MKEYIDTWKALVLVLEFFCIGGMAFRGRDDLTKEILNLICIVCGIVIFATL